MIYDLTKVYPPKVRNLSHVESKDGAQYTPHFLSLVISKCKYLFNCN